MTTTAPADALAAATGRAHRTLFRFATAGSVDDGKSTLVGRLLLDSHAVLADQLEAVARTSAQRGFAASPDRLDLALLTDGLRAEREQGITIDVAYRYFGTDRRGFVLADCPGHVEYTRNTVTGASTADAVVLLIDARHGVLEQTRRHLAVAHLLAVPHVIVAVNKIDLVDWSESAYREAQESIRAAAAELGAPEPHVVPVSALLGDNVVTASTRTPWYTGLTLLGLLERLPDVHDDVEAAEPFRLPIQAVVRPQGALAPGADPHEFRDFRGFAGQIASGSVALGDEVVVAGTGARTTITGLRVGARTVTRARAPRSVLVEVADHLDLVRGSVLAAADAVPTSRRRFPARLAWLDPRPLRPGARVLVKHGTATVKALVEEVIGRLELESLEDRPAGQLDLNDIGAVRLRTAEALPVEDYRAHRRTGAFLVVDPTTGDTLAAGIGLPEEPAERVEDDEDRLGR